MPKASRKQKQKEEDAKWAEKEVEIPVIPTEVGNEEEEEEDEPEDDDIIATTTAPKQNVFDLLNSKLAEEEHQDDELDEEEDDDDNDPEEVIKAIAPKSRKPKKKKKKGKQNVLTTEAIQGDTEEEDEIDKALKSLQISKEEDETTNTFDRNTISTVSELAALLHIDSKNLDAENEMRRLFGRAALRDEEESHTARNRRQRGIVPGAQGRGLGQGGKRNVFIQGEDNWPVASSGGLGMELVERHPDGTVEFRYVHSKVYASIQMQFLQCVRSMDPERMIMMMQTNPYHISTLLQVSHIALTQNNPPDHTSSQLLIARALFSLGRSTHSVFPTSLASGIARLDFKNFENRELWYAGWKYINSLARRGLWRTGLEMIRCLLQLDPLGDPLCMVLCIDQYALRARQPRTLLDLASSKMLAGSWSTLPNIAYSLALAHLQLGDQAKAEAALKGAAKTFPWLIAPLFKVLDLESVPISYKTVKPPCDTDQLLANLYCLRSADSWRIPEATSLLIDVIGSSKASVEKQASAILYFDEAKERDLARHIILTDVPALLSLLPRKYLVQQGLAFDILPPIDGISEYEKNMHENASATSTAVGGANGTAGLLGTFLRSLIPNFQPQPGDDHAQVMQEMEQSFQHLAPEQQRGVLANMTEQIMRHFQGGLPVENPNEAGEEPEVVDIGAGGAQIFIDGRNHETGEAEEEDDGQAEESQAVERLVQIIRSNGTGNINERLNRMFEGQGEEMAEVRRKVEERLGIQPSAT